MNATSVDQRRESLLRFVAECVNTGNFESMGETFAPEHVMHSPAGDLDSAGVIGMLSALRAAMPDFKMTIDLVAVEGDYAATRRHFAGTFTQPMPGANGLLPPNGKPIYLEILNTFRFNEAGLVVEEWTQYDNLALLTQLGAMSAPA
jgi:predicted ester cyclase